MKLRKVLAGAMAVVMVASSLLVAPVETKADAQTIADLDCTGWWTAHTAGVEIYDGGTYTINLKTQYVVDWDVDSWDGDTNLGIVQENWEAPIFVLYSGNEAKVNGDGYSEHYVGRADIWGWAGNSGATGSQTGTANCDWTNGWTTYTDAMKAGTDCKYVVTRDGATVTVICTLANVETEFTVNLPEAIANDDAVYFSLSGQCCTLKDITWTAPASLEITHPIVAVIMGAEPFNLRGVVNAVANTTDDVADVITWASSNEEVATVDAEGNITLVGIGEVTITATCGALTDACTFEVVEDTNAITAIDVTSEKTEIKVGQTTQLSTALTLENPDKASTDDTTVTYTSSDEKVATVDADGKVTAVAVGKATITASVVDGTITDTVEITVPAVPVTDIELKVDKTDLEKGDIVNIVATVSPEDTTDDTTITWTSSNEKVATVDANGCVIAVGGGNATITAAIGDVKATVDFKVTAYETVTTKTKLDNMEIGDFLSVVSDGVQLKKGHTYVITFKSASPDATSNWETPCYAVYTSKEGSYNSENWAELFLCRADVFGWPGGNFDNNTLSTTFPTDYTWTATYPEDWAAWLAECVAGTTGTITAKWDGSTVTVTYEIAGAKTVVSMPCTDSNVYLSLTGQNTNITNIEVADTYVKKVTGTGDVSMVVPMVLVLFGGAVVVVASKKKFA